MTNYGTHWTILGAGAVGHLLASNFVQNNIPTTLVTRASASIRSPVVKYTLNSNSQSLKINYTAVNHCHDIENLILAVKSYQTAAALQDIKFALNPASRIYLLQNGLGNLEIASDSLQDLINKNQLYPGSNTHGVYLNKTSTQLEIVHTGKGEIVFGNNFLDNQNVQQPDGFNHLQHSPLNVNWSIDIKRKLWMKLAINAAINPITALNNCLNGYLLESDDLKKQSNLINSETAKLFKAMGIDIEEDEINIEFKKVVHNTASNYSSMLSDVKLNKMTEIDAINGYLLGCAKPLNIPLKTHERLYNSIASLQT
jgi:2-dehydropantoate 2-reductase